MNLDAKDIGAVKK